MPLTYPLDLRTSGLRLRRVTFSLVRSVATAKLPAGLQVMETGVAIWKASIEIRPEREYGRRRAVAFVEALQGSGSFLCYSPAQCWPAAHPGGAIAGVWSDTLLLSARTETSVAAVAPNAALRLRAGDLIGLEQSGRYGLFRVMADAAPAAGSISIAVLPRIPSFFTTDAVLRLHQPACEMILDPTAAYAPGDGFSMEPVSFQAVQKVS
ncbi:hypothetical protein ACFPOB_26215 [Bosea eneae]|uniref:Hedgehog/Intein (Hint) domain-containing protein n=1 Tax=Bosea eneae TaxID=151454 RepID=A0ABW0J0C7_9HYPH